MDFLSFAIETVLTESLKYMQCEKGTRKKMDDKKVVTKIVYLHLNRVLKTLLFHLEAKKGKEIS